MTDLAPPTLYDPMSDLESFALGQTFRAPSKTVTVVPAARPEDNAHFRFLAGLTGPAHSASIPEQRR